MPARLKRTDLELAGYLTARAALGQPVQPPARQLLARVNESRGDVLALMRFGRSNVAPDLAATDNAGQRRRHAHRIVAGGMASVEATGQRSFAVAAGMAAYVGAGNCGEFANVSAHVHAKRLEPDEHLVIERLAPHPPAHGGTASAGEQQPPLPAGDHAWLRVQGAAETGGVSAILDAWGEGPPIEPRDGEFANRDRTAVETVRTIAHASAGEVNREFQSHLNGPPPSAVRRLNAVINAPARRDAAPETIYAPTPIVSQSFAQVAASAVARRRQDPALRTIAADAARSIGASPAQAAAAVPAILDIAQDLRAVHPRELERHSRFTAPSLDSSTESDSASEEPPAKRKRLVE
jgi:hypothetical protein